MGAIVWEVFSFHQPSYIVPNSLSSAHYSGWTLTCSYLRLMPLQMWARFIRPFIPSRTLLILSFDLLTSRFPWIILISIKTCLIWPIFKTKQNKKFPLLLAPSRYYSISPFPFTAKLFTYFCCLFSFSLSLSSVKLGCCVNIKKCQIFYSVN